MIKRIGLILKWGGNIFSCQRCGLSILTLVFFIFFTLMPCFPQGGPPEEISPSLEQAEALFSAGRYQDTIRMLEGLERDIDEPEDRVKLYLLKARSYLVLGNKTECEDAVRDIYDNGLSDRIEEDGLEEELRVVFSKVKAEYWFSLSKSKSDEREEKAFQRVIGQEKQKPKKKSLLPKLILGTILVGVLTGAIFLVASGKSGNDENVGTLRLENMMLGSVLVEVGDVSKIVGGANSVHWLTDPNANVLILEIEAGVYTLTVTPTDSGNGEIFIYNNIHIFKGRVTYFVFRPY